MDNDRRHRAARTCPDSNHNQRHRQRNRQSNLSAFKSIVMRCNAGTGATPSALPTPETSSPPLPTVTHRSARARPRRFPESGEVNGHTAGESTQCSRDIRPAEAVTAGMARCGCSTSERAPVRLASPHHKASVTSIKNMRGRARARPTAWLNDGVLRGSASGYPVAGAITGSCLTGRLTDMSCIPAYPHSVPIF